MDSCFHRNDGQGGGVEAEPRGYVGSLFRSMGTREKYAWPPLLRLLSYGGQASGHGTRPRQRHFIRPENQGSAVCADQSNNCYINIIE